MSYNESTIWYCKQYFIKIVKKSFTKLPRTYAVINHFCADAGVINYNIQASHSHMAINIADYVINYIILKTALNSYSRNNKAFLLTYFVNTPLKTKQTKT